MKHNFTADTLTGHDSGDPTKVTSFTFFKFHYLYFCNLCAFNPYFGPPIMAVIITLCLALLTIEIYTLYSFVKQILICYTLHADHCTYCHFIMLSFSFIPCLLVHSSTPFMSDLLSLLSVQDTSSSAFSPGVSSTFRLVPSGNEVGVWLLM